MRVLTVSAARLGVRHAVANLLAELADRGVAATYLTLPTNPAPETVERVDRLDEGRLRALEDRRGAYLAYGIFEFWRRAYRYLAREARRYDAVWLHNPRLLPLAPAGVADRAVVTYHNHLRGPKADFHDPPASWYYRLFGALERRGLARLDGARFTGVTDDVVAELLARGVDPGAVTQVGNGVDLDRFAPDRGGDVRERLGVPADATVLLYLGSLTDQKRPQALVAFQAALADRLDDPPVLLVAGDGPRREATEAAARERGLASMHVLGFVDEAEKPDVYAAADYFVLPSAYEGEPLALYEALASGLVPVASALEGLGFVADADLGHLVDFDDPRGAARQVTPAIAAGPDPDRARRAREYAAAHLGWGARAEEYRAVLAAAAGTRADDETSRRTAGDPPGGNTDAQSPTADADTD